MARFKFPKFVPNGVVRNFPKIADACIWIARCKPRFPARWLRFRTVFACAFTWRGFEFRFAAQEPADEAARSRALAVSLIPLRA